MKTTQFTQGTPQWLAHRMTCWNASDAPVMMGCSPYKTRTQLLKELHTGITPEVDAATQRRFDEGHRIEAQARDVAQEIIGEELYPVSGVHEDLTIGGRPVAASFDGLTMFEEVGFEHKTLNDELRSIQHFVGQELPLQYRAQMEQQMLVSDAKKVLFMASKWNGDTLVEERHCWYAGDETLRAQIIAGWKQFAADLAAYAPAESAPAVVAAPVEALPAPFITVTGQLALADNFAAFETRLRDFLDNQLIRKPQTDEDFVNLDAQIKEMKAGREALKRAKSQMLAQIEPVDRATKTADMLDKLLQQNCAMAEKLLAEEKDRRKAEIIASGVTRLQEHVAALNARLGKPYMPFQTADFGGVIKGLKSLASMEDKVNTQLATAKIKASEIADRIDANLKYLRDNAGDYKALFADAHAIVLKAPEDMQALVTARISEHKAEIERQAELAREKIRAEEQARAEREARARLEQEQREAAAKQAAEEAAKAPAQVKPEYQAELDAQVQAAEERRERELATHVAIDAVVNRMATVVPMPTRAPAVDTSARIKLGELNARIAPLSITADGLESLGFPVVETDKNAKLYRLADVPQILATMVRHLESVQAKAAA